jgi:hypothetical protein
MARYQSRRYAQEEDPEEGRQARRPRRSSGGPNVALILVAVVVLAAGSIAILANLQQTETSANEVEEVDPFAGLPAEEPPKTSWGTGPAKSATAFEGLEDLRDDPAWKAAVKLADEAKQLHLLATEAYDKSDRMTFREKGNAAQDKYSEALSSTDEFEARIGREHGFDHPDVKRIIATRSKWRRTLITLKKTTGI